MNKFLISMGFNVDLELQNALLLEDMLQRTKELPAETPLMLDHSWVSSIETRCVGSMEINGQSVSRWIEIQNGPMTQSIFKLKSLEFRGFTGSFQRMIALKKVDDRGNDVGRLIMKPIIDFAYDSTCVCLFTK